MWNKCAVLLSVRLPEDLQGPEATLGMRGNEESQVFRERREKLETLDDLGILDQSGTRV